MKTATTEPISEPVTFESQGIDSLIKIHLLVPNPWNRGKGEPADLEKLAESIKAKGFLQPVLLRNHPTKDDKYEIVAGEQRYHAGLLAGRTEIPALVLAEITDQEVMEVMEIENLRRVNPSPLQQAELIRKYREKGYDNQHLAAVLGESRQTLNRREKLLDLSPKWKKELAGKESPFALWTAAHLELIARFETKMQDAIMGDVQFDDPGEMSPAKLEEYLRDKTQALHLFPWKLDDETLAPKAGSCNGCQLRTGAQSDLFGEVNGKAGSEDRCMDKPCSEKKMTAHITRMKAELKKEHGEVVELSMQRYYGNTNGTLSADQYSLLKNSKDKAKPGVFVDGEKKGTWSWCLVGKDKSSTKASSSSAVKVAGEPKTSMKDRVAAKDKQRDALAIQKLRAYLEDEGDELEFTKEALDVLTQYAIAFGVTVDETGEEVDRIMAYKKRSYTEAEIWPPVLEHMLGELSGCINSLMAGDPAAEDDMVKLCAWMVDADFAELRRQAKEELPDPKSWALEKEEKPKAKGGRKPKGPAGHVEGATFVERDDDKLWDLPEDEGLDGESEGDV
jgi:ParB/RepB/Spo0J family partition protein